LGGRGKVFPERAKRKGDRGVMDNKKFCPQKEKIGGGQATKRGTGVKFHSRDAEKVFAHSSKSLAGG